VDRRVDCFELVDGFHAEVGECGLPVDQVNAERFEVGLVQRCEFEVVYAGGGGDEGVGQVGGVALLFGGYDQPCTHLCDGCVYGQNSTGKLL